MTQGNITELCQQILLQSPDAVLFADPQGNIRLWNAGAERIFGFTAAQALGQSLDLIIPERLRGVHWDGYRRVMETGESRYGTELLSVPALHRDGHQLSCEFSIVLIRDQAGEPLGIASIMRDVTARREREKALEKQLAALKAEKSA